MKFFLGFVFMMFCIFSCDFQEYKISKLKKLVEKAEKNSSKYKSEDWVRLDKEVSELELEFNQTFDDYSEIEQKEFSKLLGRYKYLKLKQGLGSIGNELNDAINQIQGVIEAINNDSLQKNNKENP
jgi:hypothetical protein